MYKNLKALSKYKRVLIVHNDKDNLLKMYQLFKKFFLSVDLAVDYKSGLKKFHDRKNKINLLITDLEMEEKSGYDLALDIRQEAHFPILFLVEDRNHLTIELSKLDDIEITQKPIDIHKILDKMIIMLKENAIDEYTIDTLIHIYKSIIEALKEIIKTGKKHDYAYHIESIINFFYYTKTIHIDCLDLDKFKMLSTKAKTPDEQKKVFIILKDSVEKMFKKYHIFI